MLAASTTPERLTPRHVCETEAFKVFPPELHAEVRIVLQTENGKGLPGIKVPNYHKGKLQNHDYGCFMINDQWQFKNPHSKWLSFDSIYDPNYNARVAYNIYKASSNTWQPWYGPCTKGKEKLARARCGR